MELAIPRVSRVPLERLMRCLSAVLVLMLVAFAHPAAAQPQGPPELTITTPVGGSTRHALNPKIRVEYGMGGQCLDDGSGDCAPIPATLLVRVNSVNRTSYFTVTEWDAQNGTGNGGNFNLNNGAWNTIYAKICNVFDCTEQTISVFIQAGPQQQVSIAPLHPSVHRPESCEAVSVAPGAALACDALLLTHAIPGYVSLGSLRTVGLVYSTRSATGQVTVPADVELVWDAAATKVQAWLQGATDSTYWNGADWDGTSGSVSRRVALVRAERTDTGGYIGRDTVTLRARVHTAAGTYDAYKVDTLPFYIERNGLTTPIARGWSISGLSRVYGINGHAPGSSAPSGDVLLVGSGGAVAHFKFLSVQNGIRSYGRPAGVFTSLTKSDADSTFQVLGIDGARQYYSWVLALGFARLDSITTPAGKTRITYKSASSGDPDSIIDPLGIKIRFAYSGSGVGSLTSICAPAGANERCTSISYGTSGGNTVVRAITDPDGGVDSLAYAGTPHWSAVTSYKPRSRGWYTIVYHANVKRPSGVVQPSSGDTVKYLAPQLAGAALTGGTSGNPATAANADSAWGWVRPPLGPTSYFTADRFGLVLVTKSPDGRLGSITRSSEGLPLSSWYYGQAGTVYRSYNALGALTATHITGGSPTTVTYGAPCANGTGYPCLPTQRVVEYGSLPPDTTKWFYTNGVVDSVYSSNSARLSKTGITRVWRGANARVDSIVDPQWHRQRFQYEGTWGNLSAVRSDSMLGVCPPPACQQTMDTTTFAYDVTGRVRSTYQGGSGRAVTIFRDRIARDTMVIDTATGGGSAITTTSRVNDAARSLTVIDGNGRSVVSLFDVRGRLMTRTDPASARDSFAYDGNDRVTSWTTRRNQTISYTYDGVERLRTKTVPNDGTWTYGYHGTYGTLDTLVTPSASIYRTHNVFGWLVSEKTVVNGVTRIVGYRHDSDGIVDTVVDPWGGFYRFGWDAANRGRTIINPFSESFSIRHSSEGMVNQIVFPTGNDVIAYDASHLVKSAGLSGEVTYARDPVTKGLASIKVGGMTQTFSYDGFGRLGSEAHDSATATYGPGSESYTYDAAGNRNQVGYGYTTTNAVRGRPSIAGDGFAPGDSLVYDAAGNPTWWRNKTTAGYDSLTWDAEDQLIRLRRYSSGGALQLDANYAYDGLGRRVKKWGTGVTTSLYVWDGWNLLAETNGGGTATRKYTYAPEALDFPLAMREGSTTSLFHLDGQGNVYLLTNTGGTRRSEYRYRGYGDRYVTPVGEAVQTPFGYKAREEDRETGLIYMRHRYYSPRLERFVNQDPIGIAGGLNTYEFIGGNPVNGRDPLGLISPCSKVITRINGEVVGVEYNWQGCEWIFDLLHALTGIQVGGWMAGLGPGGGGIDPFGGGPLPKWLKKFLDLLGVPTTPLDVATKVLPLPPTAFDNATDPPSLEERAEQCWLQWGKGNPLCTIPDTVYLPPVPWNPEVPPDGAAAPIPGFPQRRPGSCSRIPRPLYCK